MNFAALLRALEHNLHHYRAFWQLQPFHYLGNPWPQQADLWHQLQQLPEPLSLHGLKRAAFLRPWIADAEDLVHLCKIPALSPKPPIMPYALSHSMPGHKWQQVLPLVALVPQEQHIIEWCSGHGHLGRVLAAAGALSVTSLERTPALCERGQALAQRAGVTMHFHVIDVLDQSVCTLLHRDAHVVALHACGDLHTTLLQHSAQLPLQGLTVAPCCYHLTRKPTYQALSQHGQRNTLQLSRSDLRLAVKQTMTAGRAQRQRARTEVSWRLGFDCLQRELRGIDAYLPLPTIPKPILRSSFADFAHWGAQQKGLALAAHTNLDHFERLGAERYIDVRRIEWVQQLFARPLELWLLLDRALYLQQQGYQVDIGQFCPREITPRNLVICARR